jgi:hypothetical protein
MKNRSAVAKLLLERGTTLEVDSLEGGERITCCGLCFGLPAACDIKGFAIAIEQYLLYSHRGIPKAKKD